ncbi:MAG TPA: hypothetical protein VMW69_15715 [Spirochaetia bacterium]|nr:hypothetical protein [Spirochaetia bacterium]
MNSELITARLLPLAFTVALCLGCSYKGEGARPGASVDVGSTVAQHVDPRRLTPRTSRANEPLAGSTVSPLVSAASPLQAICAGAAVGTQYARSVDAGEAELSRLAKRATVEDAWLYLKVPSLWVDVGEQETRGSVTTNLEAVAPLLRLARDGAAELTLYHIHPLVAGPYGAILPPDSVDIYAFANLKRALRDRYGLMLSARVFDGTGRRSYDVSSELEDHLRLPDYSREVVRWIEYPEVRPYHPANMLMMERRDEFLMTYDRIYDPVLRDAAMCSDARVCEFIRAASDHGIIVSYAEM